MNQSTQPPVEHIATPEPVHHMVVSLLGPAFTDPQLSVMTFVGDTVIFKESLGNPGDGEFRVCYTLDATALSGLELIAAVQEVFCSRRAEG